MSIRNLLNVFKHISAQDGVDPFINAEEIFSEASQRIQPHAPRARLDFDVLAISILVYTSHRFLMSCVKFFVDPLNNFPVMLFSLKMLLSRAAFFESLNKKERHHNNPWDFSGDMKCHPFGSGSPLNGLNLWLIYGVTISSYIYWEPILRMYRPMFHRKAMAFDLRICSTEVFRLLKGWNFRKDIFHRKSRGVSCGGAAFMQIHGV